jgi:hypothetical protein
MSRGKNSDSGRPKARSVARYTIYNVTEPAELMDFLMRKMGCKPKDRRNQTTLIPWLNAAKEDQAQKLNEEMDASFSETSHFLFSVLVKFQS